VIGVDTSFLVGLTVREHPSHERCWELFEGEIVGQTASMGIAAQALTEFCHVVTDERRFEHPLAMPDAVDTCEQWWNAEEARPVVVDADVGALFMSWMREFKLGRRRLLDALLAATYHRAGCLRIATTNWRDFATFGVFEPAIV
jgi:predicted nucleic acid-binding protein